jgi:4-coumarate--CoA ligase
MLEFQVLPSVSTADLGYWSNEESTEFPRAFVVLGKGYTPSTTVDKDICEWLAKKVVHYKQLRGGVVFVETIPKTASGKVFSSDDLANGRYYEDN